MWDVRFRIAKLGTRSRGRSPKDKLGTHPKGGTPQEKSEIRDPKSSFRLWFKGGDQHASVEKTVIIGFWMRNQKTTTVNLLKAAFS